MSLRELIEMHKSILDIPSEELEREGYIRYHTHDGLIKILSLDEVEKRKKSFVKRKGESKEPLFGKIELELKGSASEYKLVDYDLANKLAKKVRKFEERFVEGIIPNFPNYHSEPISEFFKKLLALLHNDDVQEDYSFSITDMIEERPLHSEDIELPDSFLKIVYMLNEFVNYSGLEVNHMDEEDVKIICENIARTRSILSDDEFIGRYEQEHLSKIEDHMGLRRQLYGSSADHDDDDEHQPNSINFEKYIYHRFTVDVLKAEGLEEIASEVERMECLGDVRDYLCRLKGNDFPAYEEEKELRERLRGAPVEEKRELSKGFKEIKKRKKDQARLIQGAIQFIERHKYVGRLIEQTLNTIEDHVMRKSDEVRIETYCIDGTPDKKYEENPGEISGDCTKGHPLPFFRNDTYNVPILRLKDDGGDPVWVGNIYILDTYVKSTEERVWHIDAIQFPGCLDWNHTINLLIEKIGQEAEKKGVAYVTANHFEEYRSNYDYIQVAMGNAAIETPKFQIVIPKSEYENYSTFQGKGNDIMVLWKHE